MPLLGEAAALATATLWAFGSLLFLAAARRVGAFALNLSRITFAFVILSLLVLATRGADWAPGAEPRHVLLLALSGWIGLTLGDWALFNAMVHLGARLATLLMTLAPPLAALIAIPVLGESLGPTALFGMALTLLGVVWVVLERGPDPIPRGHRLRGVGLGALGALGQALGLVLSKLGMEDRVDPLPATAIRMGAATLGVWVLAAVYGRRSGLVRLLRDPPARRAALGATLLGPVCGVWLSLVAVRFTKAGIAATLMATTPVLLIPILVWLMKEPVSRRATWGAIVSVLGIAVLFLR